MDEKCNKCGDRAELYQIKIIPTNSQAGTRSVQTWLCKDCEKSLWECVWDMIRFTSDGSV